MRAIADQIVRKMLQHQKRNDRREGSAAMQKCR